MNLENKHDEYLNELISSKLSHSQRISGLLNEVFTNSLDRDSYTELFTFMEDLNKSLEQAKRAETELFNRRVLVWDSKKNSGTATKTEEPQTSGM